ncbi:MAG: hypothetical protein P8099_07085 [Gemmatimonadota bacterium]
MQASDPVAKPAARKPIGRGRSAAYWALALLVMLVAAAYQRRTGPTYPVNGQLHIDGQVRHYELLTSHDTRADAPVVVPDPGGAPAGTLYYRRYPTNEPFTTVPLRVEDGNAVAALPAQPPAGKLQYYLRLQTRAGPVRIPADPDDVIIRFKGHVPLGVLLPHVLLMFLAMLVGVRTALAAFFRTGETRALAWTTLAGFTLGGMILGPVVQKFAFGAAWTGVPLGWDLTDNKTLVMWLAWLAACVVPEIRRLAYLRRSLVLSASAVMLVVYLIPHSLLGSQFEYSGAAAGLRRTAGSRWQVAGSAGAGWAGCRSEHHRRGVRISVRGGVGSRCGAWFAA